MDEQNKIERREIRLEDLPGKVQGQIKTLRKGFGEYAKSFVAMTAKRETLVKPFAAAWLAFQIACEKIGVAASKPGFVRLLYPQLPEAAGKAGVPGSGYLADAVWKSANYVWQLAARQDAKVSGERSRIAKDRVTPSQKINVLAATLFALVTPKSADPLWDAIGRKFGYNAAQLRNMKAEVGKVEAIPVKVAHQADPVVSGQVVSITDALRATKAAIEAEPMAQGGRRVRHGRRAA